MGKLPLNNSDAYSVLVIRGVKHEALNFLFNELDELGKQTQLNQLLWAAKISIGDSFPKKIEDQIKKEINLI